MKNFTSILKATLLLVATILITSCSGDQIKNSDLYQEEVPQKIADFIESDSHYSMLNQAIAGSDIQDWLANQERITFFAPTDTAFEAYLSQNGFSSVDEIPQDDLLRLLKSHIIISEVFLSDLNATEELVLETMAQTQFDSSAQIVSLVTNRDGLKINGIDVTTPDLLFVNGVVHSVDRIVELSTAATFIEESKRFTRFKEIIELSDNTETVLENFRTPYHDVNSQEMTFFAPENAAVDFFTLNLVTTNSITNSSNQLLNFALNTQISTGENYEVDELQDNSTIHTLGANVSVTISGNNDISFRTSPFSDVVGLTTEGTSSIQTSNGIILITNKVLY